jgi:hypothetical protein
MNIECGPRDRFRQGLGDQKVEGVPGASREAAGEKSGFRYSVLVVLDPLGI